MTNNRDLGCTTTIPFDSDIRKIDVNNRTARYFVKNIGILANSKLSLKDNNEIQFFGKTLNFAVVMGDITEYKTLEDFIKSFDDAKLSGNGSKTELNYLGNHYYGHYKKGLFINRKKIRIIYDRFETPFVNSKRAASEIIISHGSKKLVLNFDKQL